MAEISVIIPMYNAEKYIYKCLQSLIFQTFNDFEVIIIDDGSFDNSFLIAKDFTSKDNRFKLIYQNNQGLAGARNTGISNATSKFICFLDSDDYLDSKALNQLYNLIISTKSDLVISNINQFSRKKEFKGLRYKNESFNVDDNNFKFWSASLDSSCNKLYKLSIIKSNNIYFVDKDIFPLEDFLFNFKYLCYTNNVLTTEFSTYFYRMRMDSITKSNKNMNTILKILKFNFYVESFVLERDIKKNLKEFLSFAPIYIHFIAINSMNINRNDIKEIVKQSKKTLKNKKSLTLSNMLSYSKMTNHKFYYFLILCLIKINLIAFAILLENFRIKKLYSLNKIDNEFYK